MAYSPSRVSTEQRAQLHEVADLMLEIYETLAEMTYLDPKGIDRGPHDVSKLEEVYAEHGLDPAIIYLYSILPYIDEREAGNEYFFKGGQFVDFRDPRQVVQGRDPHYASPKGDFDAERGQFMRAWMTPLSQMAYQSTVILYDAREHRIWCKAQLSDWSSDPALQSDNDLKGTPYENERPKSDWGDDSSGDYEESEDDGSDGSRGSSEFWSDDDEQSTLAEQEALELRKDQLSEDIAFDEGFEILSDEEQQQAQWAVRHPNINSFEHLPSRPAGDVLRDINRWYRELKECPGWEYAAAPWRSETLRPLYLKNGWPDEFDAEGFEIDQGRAYAAERAKWSAEEPLRSVQMYKNWLNINENGIDAEKQKILKSRSNDEKWMAKFELWKLEAREEKNIENLREATEEAERKCPGGLCQREEDLPLWELEQLRKEVQEAQTGIERHPGSDAAGRHRRRQASIYSKAYEASKAEAEKICPGRTLEDAIGFKFHKEPTTTKADIELSKYWITDHEKEIQKMSNWMAQLPEGLNEARKFVECEIAKYRKCKDTKSKQLEEHEKRLSAEEV